MALTIGVAACVLILALVGLMRGLRRGIVALAGTLLAAVLIDLWQARWISWLRETMQFEQWALPAFVLIAIIFLGVTLLVGYGGSILLPPEKPGANNALARLLGGLIGAINGALIASYLLRYASEIWPDATISTLLAGSPAALILNTWLPWFILALVGTTAVFVILRATVRISRALNARPTAAPPTMPTAKIPPTSSSSVANSSSLREADQKLSEKIDQRAGR
ncbi:MAG: CvpA family protein [Oscillochloris sp.]|nr:CvpA family protein [Oscillochloris sp.]